MQKIRCLFSLGLVGATMLLVSCLGSGMSGPSLIVTPRRVVAGDPIQIRATGLQAGQSAVLAVTGVDQYGQSWRSSATFLADAHGALDVATQAPGKGSYAGVDRAGLFWSMALEASATQVTPFVAIEQARVSLSVGERQAAMAEVALSNAVDVDIEELTGEVKGYFCKPRGVTGRLPAMVILGGAEGGAMKGFAANLASRLRYPALALQYFNYQDKPPTFLDQIPIETVQKALAWLNGKPTVKADSFVLYGVSRGSELALLSAVMFPDQVKAVVGNVPSCYAWQGLGRSQKSAWSWQGAPIPCLPITMNEDLYNQYTAAQASGTPFSFRKVYAYSLSVATQAQMDAARIPLERAKAAIMLISSEVDGVWMSSTMAGSLVEKLRSCGYAHEITALSWPASGHVISHGYQPTTLRRMLTQGVWMDFGGTAQGTAQASDESWYALMGFLNRNLQRLKD